MNQIKKTKRKKTKRKKTKIENIIDGVIDMGKFFELTTSDKTYVTGINEHEIKSQVVPDCTGNFELNGSMVIGPV